MDGHSRGNGHRHQTPLSLQEAWPPQYMPIMSIGMHIPGMMLPMTYPMQARPSPFPLASALLQSQLACLGKFTPAVATLMHHSECRWRPACTPGQLDACPANTMAPTSSSRAMTATCSTSSTGLSTSMPVAMGALAGRPHHPGPMICWRGRGPCSRHCRQA